MNDPEGPDQAGNDQTRCPWCRQFFDTADIAAHKSQCPDRPR